MNQPSTFKPKTSICRKCKQAKPQAEFSQPNRPNRRVGKFCLQCKAAIDNRPPRGRNRIRQGWLV